MPRKAKNTQNTQNTAQRQNRKANVDRVLKAAAAKTKAARVAQIKSEAKQVKAALRKAKAKAELPIEEIVEQDGEPASRSVVPPKFRKRYAPNNDSNGDSFSQELRDYLEVEILGQDGELRGHGIDTAKLRRLAEANGCWKPEYEHLNAGMQRMNVGNRLRAKVRRGEAVSWA